MYETEEKDSLREVLLAYCRFADGGGRHVPLPERHVTTLQYFEQILRRETRDYCYSTRRCSRCRAELWVVPDSESPIGASGQGVVRCRVCEVPYFIVCSPDGWAELTPINSEERDMRESADSPKEYDVGALPHTEHGEAA